MDVDPRAHKNRNLLVNHEPNAAGAVAAIADRESAWYEAHGCDHAHCPFRCEHPQPFLRDGVMICGRCYFVHHTTTPVVPCVPGACEDH